MGSVNGDSSLVRVVDRAALDVLLVAQAALMRRDAAHF